MTIHASENEGRTKAIAQGWKKIGQIQKMIKEELLAGLED
jgi:hypothetical protein